MKQSTPEAAPAADTIIMKSDTTRSEATRFGMDTSSFTRLFFFFALVLAAAAAMAAPQPKHAAPGIPPFPGTLINATYVYVTSYDGDQFDINLLSEDRQAISTVQDALQNWGKFTLVYRPQDADIVLMVMSRPSEDVLAVYDAHSWPRNAQYLWRVTERNGLQKGETPLVTNLQKAFEAATAAKK